MPFGVFMPFGVLLQKGTRSSPAVISGNSTKQSLHPVNRVAKQIIRP
jgi:hypothetical protein